MPILRRAALIAIVVIGPTLLALAAAELALRVLTFLISEPRTRPLLEGPLQGSGAATAGP